MNSFNVNTTDCFGDGVVRSKNFTMIIFLLQLLAESVNKRPKHEMTGYSDTQNGVNFKTSISSA